MGEGSVALARLLGINDNGGAGGQLGAEPFIIYPAGSLRGPG